MRINKLHPLVYFGAGLIADRAVKRGRQRLGGARWGHALFKLAEKDRLMKIEKRRVDDVMGDTIGYINSNGDIIKGDFEWR